VSESTAGEECWRTISWNSRRSCLRRVHRAHHVTGKRSWLNGRRSRNFARAVCDNNPVYRNAEAAIDAGFADIPAPPTFGSPSRMGKWEELQPAEPSPDGNPRAEVFVQLMSKGGIVLHGEQEFHYHRPIVAGERLQYERRRPRRLPEGIGRQDHDVHGHRGHLSGRRGHAVLTSIMNLLHRG